MVSLEGAVGLVETLLDFVSIFHIIKRTLGYYCVGVLLPFLEVMLFQLLCFTFYMYVGLC